MESQKDIKIVRSIFITRGREISDKRFRDLYFTYSVEMQKIQGKVIKQIFTMLIIVNNQSCHTLTSNLDLI